MVAAASPSLQESLTRPLILCGGSLLCGIRARAVTTALALTALTLSLAGCEKAEPADLVLVNAAIYTLDDADSRATAIALRDGRILATGSDAVITAAYSGPVRDLGGQMVLPGFHDAHAHPIGGGLQLRRCDLAPHESVDAIVAAVARCAAALPPGAWLQGGGWDLSLFPEARADKALLDAVAPDRPVFLRGADGHSAWVNSMALSAAGITADTPNPPLGIIERDAAGEPLGTLRESAQALVEAVLPPTTPAELEAAALAGLGVANAFGITSIIDASVDAPLLATWRALEANGRLTARIVASVSTEGGLEGALALADPSSRGSAALVRADAAKIFLDGVLEGETAALLQPYLGRDGARGALLRPFPELEALVVGLDAAGLQIHMHAIGDAAAREGLDALEAARLAHGDRGNRHHISHLQLVHPDDYARFGALDVAANFQALWAFPDKYIRDVNLPVVGAERVARMYPLRSIEAAGGTLVFGSDWFVSSMNPLLAIETAVTRQNPLEDAEDQVLNEAERISLRAALLGFTRHGARLMHQEGLTGSLEPGKAADLVVLERDLFAVPAREIGAVPVTLTLFNGAIVYERGAPVNGAPTHPTATE